MARTSSKKQEEIVVAEEKPALKVSQRTGKTTVALVGFAPTSRDYAPWDDLDTDIVGMNEAYRAIHKDNRADGEVYVFMKRWTHWFQLHSHANFSRPNNPNDENHYQWLKEARGFPIYMQKKYKEIPSSVRYPLEEASALGGRYFTSTFAFEMAWALLQGYQRIEIFGFEMQSDTEYAYQRSASEYWIGLAKGMGREVVIPPGCNLLTGQLYGYEKMSIGYRQRLEIRKANLKQQLEHSIAKFNQMTGSLQVLKELANTFPDSDKTFVSKDAHKNFADEAVKMEAKIHEQGAVVNIVNGAHQESEQAIKFYDQYPFEEDAGDGETDDA